MKVLWFKGRVMVLECATVVVRIPATLVFPFWIMLLGQRTFRFFRSEDLAFGVMCL